MSELLTVTDLEIAKKHDTFHSEVITGKVGGLATGANIDTATNQVTGQTQTTLPKVLLDLGMKVQAWPASVGGTLTDLSQVFLNDITGSAGKGNYYAWSGAFPKTVPAGLDPAATAGFIMRSDAGFRKELGGYGGIKKASACRSVHDLLQLTDNENNQRVDVIGFYDGTVVGGGTFVFNTTAAKSAHNGITVISPTVPFTGISSNTLDFLSGTGETDPAGLGCWVRVQKNTWLETAMAGAVMDGVFDDAPLCQKLHNIGAMVEYTPGNYLFNTAVTPLPGQHIFAAGAGRFNVSYTKNVSIMNNNVNGGIFNYISDTSTGQVDAPWIHGFVLTADYPIRLNDHYAYICDGVNGTSPYLMRPLISNNTLMARSAGTGIGIVFSKCFDGSIEDNEIYDFAVNILLLGSDINEVKRNRLMGHTQYGIIDRSVQSAGSQNEISLNDILYGAAGSVYIKSNSRHVRIYNNYCERGPGVNISGFISISKYGMPTWNVSNVDGEPQSIFIDANRLDGWEYCSDFIYNLNIDTPAATTTIRDSSTTGYAGSAPALRLEGADTNGYLKYASGSNNENYPEYAFYGKFNKLSGFATKCVGDKIELNASNLTNAIGGDIYANAMNDYVRTNGESICLLTGLTGLLFARFKPDAETSIANQYLPATTTFTVEVLARTTSGSGDTLRIGRLVNTTGGTLNSFNLTTQFKKFTFTMAGSASTDSVGVYLNRTTFNGVIQIKSIRFIG